MTHAVSAAALPVYLTNARLTLQSDIYRTDGEERVWHIDGNDTVTFRDQMHDPVFQFLQLVAGAANEDIDAFMFDDSDESNNMQQQTIVENYASFKQNLQQRLETLRPWLFMQIRLRDMYNEETGSNRRQQGTTEYEVNSVEDLEQVVRDNRGLAPGRSGRPPLRTVYCANADLVVQLRDLVTLKTAEHDSVVADIDTLSSKIAAVQKNAARRPWTVLTQAHDLARETLEYYPDGKLKEKVMNRTTSDTKKPPRLFFSGEIVFKPPFIWALSLAQQKLNGRCQITKNNDEELAQQLCLWMTSPKFKTLFAQLVAANYLIARGRNSHGEWQKDIAYKRLVRMENSVILALRTRLGYGAARHSLLGYDSVAPSLFA